MEEKENVMTEPRVEEVKFIPPAPDDHEMLDILCKASDANLSLIWLAATMATITAIGMLGGTLAYRGLVFMVVGLISLIIYRKRYR